MRGLFKTARVLRSRNATDGVIYWLTFYNPGGFTTRWAASIHLNLKNIVTRQSICRPQIEVSKRYVKHRHGLLAHLGFRPSSSMVCASSDNTAKTRPNAS